MEKAYLIMAHKSAAQLCRLVDRLNDNHSYFFVHIDKKTNLNLFIELEKFGERLIFLERFDSQWGKYGTTLPLLAGLKKIRDVDHSFDRILLLSGQDYPIKSNQDINEFFNQSAYSVFINHFPIPDFEKWPGKDRGGLYRVDKYYFGNKWYQMFCSRSINLLAHYFPFLRRKIPYNMTPFAGQTWINLDMYALNYILNFHETHPDYLNFHKYTFVSDEVFIHMLIANSSDKKLLASIENSERRFTIWDTPQSAHPKILQQSDFESIKLSADLFARKFDEQIDSEILDMIDERILFKDQ